MKRIEYFVFTRGTAHLRPENFENVDRVIFYAISPDKDGEVFSQGKEATVGDPGKEVPVCIPGKKKRLFKERYSKEFFVSRLNDLRGLLKNAPDTEIYLGVGDLGNLLAPKHRDNKNNTLNHAGLPAGDYTGPINDDNRALNVFLGHVKSLVDDYGFSGVDLNWEGRKMTVQDYIRTVQYLGMPSITGKPVSVCIGYYQDEYDRYFEKAGRSECDSVNVQCYGDFTDNTLEFGKLLDTVVFNSVMHRVPLEKVNIGLPLYVISKDGGHEYGWKHHVDAGGNPCLDIDHSHGVPVGTNGLCTVASRVLQIKRHGFPGVFTWDIALDFAYPSGVSIGRAINTVLGK